MRRSNFMTVKKVLISPVVLPEFRVGLYDRLNDDPGLDITIAHGSLSMPVFKSAQKKLFKEVKLNNKEIRVGGFTLVWQVGLFREVTGGSYDIVVAQGNFGILSSYIPLFFRWLQKKKNMVWMCAYERPGIKGMRKRVRDAITSIVLKLFHGGVTYSTYAKKYLINRNMPLDKIKILGNTIDVVSLHNKIIALDKERCRNELGLKKDVILFAGKFTPAKQIDLLINALKALVVNRGRDNLQLVLLGDGPILRDLKMLVRDLCLEDYVRFEGVVIEGKEKYFRTATVAVMPGSGGLLINDCMASRLPIILSYSDGTHFDLIKDRETGVLFSRDDVYDLADKIAMLLDDKSLRKKIADNAEQLILTKYTLDKMADNFKEALKSL